MIAVLLPTGSGPGSRGALLIVRLLLLASLASCVPSIPGQAARDMTSRSEEELLEILTGLDAIERRYAAVELGHRGGAGVAALEQGLRDEEPAVRMVALEGLAEVEAWRHFREALPAVERALQDSHRGVRAQALETLWRRSGSTSLEAVARLLGDTEHAVRRRAAQYLGEHAEGKGLAPVLQLLRDELPAIRLEAIQVLGRYTWPSGDRPQLVQAIADDDRRVARTAAGILLQLGQELGTGLRPLEPSLVRLLARVHPDLRASILQILALLEAREAGTLQVLLDLLEQEVEVELVVEALGRMEATPELANDLEPMVLGGGEVGMLLVQEVLGRWKAAVPTLQRTLEAEDPLVREAAAAALGSLGAAGRVGTEALLEALGDPEVSVRLVAAQSLGQLWSGPEVEPGASLLVGLGTALEDEESLVRLAAAQSLGLLGPAAAEMIPALLSGVPGAGEEEVRVRLEAIGQVGPAAAASLQGLARLALERGEFPERGELCCRAIEASQAAASRDLVTLLRLSGRGGVERALRAAAGKALVRLGADATEAQAPLVALLEQDRAPGQLWAARALGAQGAAARDTLPALERALARAREAGMSESRLQEALVAAIEAITAAPPR